MELRDLNQNEQEIIGLLREASRNADPKTVVGMIKEVLKDFPRKEGTDT